MGTAVSLPESARKVLLCSEAPMAPNGPQDGFAGTTSRIMQALSPARVKRQGKTTHFMQFSNIKFM
jgi:hypothetical protein